MAITSRSLRIFFAGIFVFGVQVACQQTFLALGQAKISLVLALLRKMILLVPLIFILPATLKAFMAPLDLVFMAEPVANIIFSLNNSHFALLYSTVKHLSIPHKNRNLKLKKIRLDII